MKSTLLTLTTAVGLALGVLVTSQAQAAPVTAGNVAQHTAADLVQKTQIYVYGGRNYCWYLDGWHGPGYYWCGYAWRRGYGWGGGYGWRGWGPGPRGYYRGDRGHFEGRGRR